MIERLRRLRMTSSAIAARLGMAVSTVCAVLARLGLNRLSRLGPPEPPNRYCRRHPGELVHLDVKKLGTFWRPGHRSEGTRQGTRNRGAGWEFVHVAVDDTTRLAYVEVLPSEGGDDTVAFLSRAVEFFARYGITGRALLTDNGTNYRSLVFAAERRDRNLRHLRTQPYRPRTNGTAERFIQTMLRERAYTARSLTARHGSEHFLPDRLLQPPTTPWRSRPQGPRHPAPSRLTNVTGNYS